MKGGKRTEVSIFSREEKESRVPDLKGGEPEEGETVRGVLAVSTRRKEGRVGRREKVKKASQSTLRIHKEVGGRNAGGQREGELERRKSYRSIPCAKRTKKGQSFALLPSVLLRC